MLAVLLPLGDHGLNYVRGWLVSVIERLNNAFAALGIVSGLQALLVVADDVVVQFKTSLLLLLQNKLAHFEEEIVNLAVLRIPLTGDINCASRLVGL